MPELVSLAGYHAPVRTSDADGSTLAGSARGLVDLERVGRDLQGGGSALWDGLTARLGWRDLLRV